METPNQVYNDVAVFILVFIFVFPPESTKSQIFMLLSVNPQKFPTLWWPQVSPKEAEIWHEGQVCVCVCVKMCVCVQVN